MLCSLTCHHVPIAVTIKLFTLLTQTESLSCYVVVCICVKIEVRVIILMSYSVRWSNGRLRPVSAPSRGRELQSDRLLIMLCRCMYIVYDIEVQMEVY